MGLWRGVDQRVESGGAGLRLLKLRFARRALRAGLLLLLKSGCGTGVILLRPDFLFRPLEK